MELELRDYSSGDIDQVWTWEPSYSDEVYFQLTIEIGEKGTPGGSLFQLVVATPEGLRAVAESRHGYEFPDRALHVFSHYSWDVLLTRLNGILRRCSRDTWTNSVTCLQRYFQWEYEDYKWEESA